MKRLIVAALFVSFMNAPALAQSCAGDLPCGPIPFDLVTLPVLASPTPFVSGEAMPNPEEPEDDQALGFFEDIEELPSLGELDEESIEAISGNIVFFMGYVNAIRSIDLGVLTPAFAFFFVMATATIGIKLSLLLLPILGTILGILRKAWGMLPFT